MLNSDLLPSFVFWVSLPYKYPYNGYTLYENCIRLEVYGSKGSAWWNSEEPNLLHLGHRDQPNQCWIRNPGQMQPPASGYADYPAGHN